MQINVNVLNYDRNQKIMKINENLLKHNRNKKKTMNMYEKKIESKENHETQ